MKIRPTVSSVCVKGEVNIRRFLVTCVIFRIYEGQKPLGGLTSNFVVVNVRDVITCFKFGDDRFRDLGSADGQILPLFIDFDGHHSLQH